MEEDDQKPAAEEQQQSSSEEEEEGGGGERERRRPTGVHVEVGDGVCDVDGDVQPGGEIGRVPPQACGGRHGRSRSVRWSAAEAQLEGDRR